jgi:FMN-dependent NADH-azoreductase
LNRLIAQDNILHDLLIPHIEATNQEYLDKLTKLEKGLQAMENAIEKLTTAKNNLIKAGLYETQIFKEEARAFLDVFLNMLAINRHSTIDLESKVFTPKDWEKLAGVTEESIQMEEKLFLNAKLSAPEGCDPESFPPLGHHQKPS